MIHKSSLGEKLRLIREAEGLSRREMEEVTGVSQNNLKNYEILGRMIPGETLLLILNHPRFRKYSDWVMFNQTNAATGQIAPPLSLWLLRFGGRSGFNRNKPKITPLRPENWLDLLFVWSDYCWKEAGEIVERFIGGLRNVN